MFVVMPLFVFMLLRLNRQYEHEAQLLEHDVPAAATAPILRRHVVLVFVDRLDMASARAIQYARTLTPDELRAVHFVIDDAKAQELAEEWARTGLQRVPLELVDVPRSTPHAAAVECVVRELADGETEVSVLLPDRKYRGIWHRVLHDKTADAILEQLSRLPHANVTTVPFHLDAGDHEQVPLSAIVTDRGEPTGEGRGRRRTVARGGERIRGRRRPWRHADHRRPVAGPRAGGRRRAIGAGGAPARRSDGRAHPRRRGRCDLGGVPGTPSDRGHRRRDQAVR